MPYGWETEKVRLRSREAKKLKRENQEIKVRTLQVREEGEGRAVHDAKAAVQVAPTIKGQSVYVGTATASNATSRNSKKLGNEDINILFIQSNGKPYRRRDENFGR